MKFKYIDKEIKYIGSQLAPHWIYKNFNILSDAVVSFCGGADVKITEMVDLEDVIQNDSIYSPNMLHFIVEKFNTPLIEGVYLQRLLVIIAKEIIEKFTGMTLVRNGDDLFFNEKKLSVSIATCSFNSILIHFAMNITTEGTPIETSGLKSDLHIENIKELAEMILEKYTEEIEDIKNASCKVRGVL